MNDVEVHLRLNGGLETFTAPTSEMLVDSVRERFGLTGTKIGCDQASCGACTVRVDGDPVASCSTFAWQVDGAEVTTIEALVGSPEQRAFAESSAFQCGYCTPGLIMSTAALLDEHGDVDVELDEERIRTWLGSNICRCTGYQMVIEAVGLAAARRRARAV